MKKFLLLFFVPLVLSAKERAPIEESKLLNVGIGVFNIVRNTKAVNFQIEYRSDFPFYRNSMLFFRPLIGVMGTTQGSGYIYTGIAFDIFFTERIVFTPSFAPGIYMKGGGMELGFPLEYRSSAELSYRFKNKSRFGGMFYHISNASLGFRNPGTECLVFFYSIPLP
ncbi:MAG: acyloxyacyl hydrolase [Chlamydiales bacterium]|nr:acyloxyacyl hydrolase [Chlamydiia bacterium]MCP5504536.1 acyloxyacyl hydrolase [Chlamydiales bacterium]